MDEHRFYEVLGRLMREFRLKAGLTQEVVGVGMGFCRSQARKAVSELETDRTTSST